jgi:hypothetical protein
MFRLILLKSGVYSLCAAVHACEFQALKGNGKDTTLAEAATPKGQ